MLGRIDQPDLLGAAQVIDFFLHLLQEYLADIVIDAFGIGIETGVRRQYIAHRHLLELLFLDLDPVVVLLLRHVAFQHRWRGRFGLCKPQPIEVVGWRGIGFAVTHKQMAEVIAGQETDGFGKFRVLLVFDITDG